MPLSARYLKQLGESEMEPKMLNGIVSALWEDAPESLRAMYEEWIPVLDKAATDAGYTICDLKPLAELLGCEPVIEHIYELIANRQTWVSQRVVGQLVAQALNWERTEFNTLDELLEELREVEQAHSNFVDQAIANDENMDAAFDKLCRLAEQISPVPMLLDDAIGLLSPDREPPCTHTLLHAGELYRDVTILLRTEQLVAWRTADGQEYSAPAHQVLLDPDEDGLAAAILSRIAGVEIAPEHMAELRAQMGVSV
ncbi:MAG: hypothetical protein ACRCXB_14065 [Aeromonadaceae bacterium]